jgi:hypothetical protein
VRDFGGDGTLLLDAEEPARSGASPSTGSSVRKVTCTFVHIPTSCNNGPGFLLHLQLSHPTKFLAVHRLGWHLSLRNGAILTSVYEAFEINIDKFLYTTFSVIDDDGVFYFGQLSASKLKFILEQYTAALERIPDEDLFPEVR